MRVKQAVQKEIDGYTDTNVDDIVSDDPRLGDLSIVVTTYEMAIRDESLLKRTKWQYCVVDEGHRLKNVQSRLGVSLRALCIPRRLLLTGTPLQNNLQELWSLLNFYVIIVERFVSSPIRNPCAGNNGRWTESIMTTVIMLRT